MKVRGFTGRSDPGRKRHRNEDAFVCEPPLFAVADGMGGAQAGEVASQLAAGALREGNGTAGEAGVVSLIQEANRRVWQRANEDAAASGMGTTITVAVVEPDGRVFFGHVGDSRAYMLRGGRLRQLTQDHSRVAELVRRGELSPEEAETHPQRSVITRALGTDPDVDVDTFAVDAEDGDVFLLCSDGLSSMVDHSTVEQVLLRNRADLDAAAQALVAAANRGGGEDNITVIAFVIAADGDETARLPAASEEDTLTGVPAPPIDTMVVPPEQVEDVFVEPGSPEAEALARPQPISPAARVRLVLTMLALLGVAAVLLAWGLLR